MKINIQLKMGQKSEQIASPKESRCQIFIWNNVHHLLLKMQIETMKYNNISITMAEIQISDNTNCWQACRAIETFIHVGVNAESCMDFRYNLVVYYKAKCSPIMSSSNFAPGHLLNWSEKLCPHENMYING